MPYFSLPNEAAARGVIQRKLEAISPGLLPPGVTTVIQVGGYAVEFIGNNTCTSVIVRNGVYTLLRGTVRSVWTYPDLSLGKTFIRGGWERAFGVQPNPYCAYSADPFPDILVARVREVLDGHLHAGVALENLKLAMDDLAEFVDCIRDRSGTASAMIDIVFNRCEATFLVALAVVLRVAGARSCDAQCILDFVDTHGGDTSAVLSELLDAPDRIERFERLMAIAPEDEQVAFVRQTIEQHHDLLGWVGRHLQNQNDAWDFYDRLATAFQRAGFELVRSAPNWLDVVFDY